MVMADHASECSIWTNSCFRHTRKQITKALGQVWVFKALSLLVFYELHNSSSFAVYWNSILWESTFVINSNCFLGIFTNISTLGMIMHKLWKFNCQDRMKNLLGSERWLHGFVWIGWKHFPLRFPTIKIRERNFLWTQFF